MGEHFGQKLTKDGVTAIFYRSGNDTDFATMRLYGECRNTADHRNDNPGLDGSHRPARLTLVSDRLRCRSTVSSHRPCLKPTAVSRPASTNPRLRCRAREAGAVGVDDHGDDLANTRAGAFGEQRVEQPAADPAADRIGCDVDRVLHGVAVGGSRFPRCAVGISGDPAVQRCGQERQSVTRDGMQAALPFRLIGRSELERRDAGLHVVGVDPADVIEVVWNGTPDRDIGLAHNAFRASAGDRVRLAVRSLAGEAVAVVGDPPVHGVLNEPDAGNAVDQQR